MKDAFMGEKTKKQPDRDYDQNAGEAASSEFIDTHIAYPEHPEFSDTIFDNLKLEEAKQKLAELLLEIEKLRADTGQSTGDFQRMTVIVGRLLSLEHSQQKKLNGLYATFNEDEFSPVVPAERNLLEDIRSALQECNEVIKTMVATAYPESAKVMTRIQNELTVAGKFKENVRAIIDELESFEDRLYRAELFEAIDPMVKSSYPSDFLKIDE